MIRLAAVLLLSLSLAACAGDGSTLPAAPGTGPTPAFAPTFTNVKANVLTPICSVDGCHDPVTLSGGMNLTPSAAYANLVGVVSSEAPPLKRVDAAKPAVSYMMIKLDGSSGIVDQRMPLGGPYLSAEVRESIREWIALGAPDN